jgi:SSS family solute:Na+ symporter
MVAVAYFVAGGLLSSAWVNRVQLILILAGFAVVAPIALGLAGGYDRIATARPESFFGGGDALGWRYLFILGPAFIVSPGLLQKAFGAESASALTRGVALNGLVLMAFAFAPAIIGASAAILYPGLESRNLALPAVISGSLPTWGAALALAAVFSAEVSTVDAVLFMLATSGSRDLYAGFVNRRASDQEILRVARGLAVAGAIAGIGLAFVFDSVERALQTFYAILTVTLFVPVLAALHMPVRGVNGFASVVAGLTVLMVVQWLTGGDGFGIVTPTLAGILASAAAFGASTFFARPASI